MLEGIFLWSGIFLYPISFLTHLSGLIFKKGRQELGWWIFILAFVAQSSSMATRWIVSGHLPVMGGYEHYQWGSWCVGLTFLVDGSVYPRLRPLGLIASAVILIMLGLGIRMPREIVPLSPPYQSNWLWVHVGFAWFAWGSFVIAAGIGLVYLLKDYFRESRFLARFPELKILDELMLKFVLFGFICQSLMVVSGSIWAHQLWGRYWGWDPIETWSLICWLVYGVFIHLRLMFGWKGKKAAGMVILALITAVIYFWGVGFISASHTPLM